MPTYYHGLAGQSLERLAMLSDGVFAIAMTVLVLNLRVPVNDAVHAQHPVWAGGTLHSEHVVWNVLGDLAPQLLTYLMSFLTLGMFWVGQQTLFGRLAGTNRTLTWIQLAFLASVSLVPFSTELLSEYITYRLALVVYWLNLLLLGVVLLASLRYANRAALMTQDATVEVRSAIERRIVVVQVLYAVGLALCVFNTYVSIAFIVLLQLNSAISPQIRPLNRY